jgi:hypothetical protein
MTDYQIKLELLQGEELFCMPLDGYALVRGGVLFVDGKQYQATAERVDALYNELVRAIPLYDMAEFANYA